MLKNANKRLRIIELQRARAGGVCAVLLAIGKEPEQVERELLELHERLPAGQTVIVIDR
jgi:16S rRNA G1207 methylase RsmC